MLGTGQISMDWLINPPKPSVLKAVLQGEEVEKPNLGGALIPNEEKLFPKSEARMDPVGQSSAGTWALPLGAAFPLHWVLFIVALGL